jgi:alkylation response protein AidB-like acyl-CoA dehydrogenase
MRIALESAEAYLDRVCDDWSNGVDHGGEWPLKIVACKHQVVSQAWSVIDTALDVSGGSGVFKRSRLERLVRDGRLGRLHPGNPMLTHELVGKISLGINPDEQPRWG